ncbi:MAG: terminase large subunit [Bacteroidales bacterium]
MNYIKIAEKYIDNVLSGKISVSETTKKTFVRHRNDLKKGKFVFDASEPLTVMEFAAHLKHTKGRKYAGKPFVLEPWQCAIIYILFGWKRKDGNRRFSKAYVEIAKKNGKTAFAGFIADYLLIMDGEPEAEVYCAATKKDQAKLCFNQAKAYIEKNTQLKEFSGAKFYTGSVIAERSGSKMQPLGRDSYGLDGINPSAAIIDEYHEWKQNDVLDAIESASVGRTQTLIFIITTAGFNKNWPCFEFRRFCIDILDGVKQQDDVFVLIYTLDEDDDWRDEKNWHKANPNYAVSVETEKVKEQFSRAVNQGGRTEVNFKTKNLNVWVDAPETWISDDIIRENNAKFDTEKLKGEECYMGLDLAAHTDINALACFFPKYKVVKFYFWVPESKVAERKDRVDYELWRTKGLLNVTPGNIVDIDQQIADITEIVKRYDVKGLAYDPYMSYNGTIQGLLKEGFDKILHEFPQSLRVMSEPTKDLDRMLNNKELNLLDNPVIRWMFRNVSLLRDTNDNIKPDRKRSIDKIDGVVALINAIGEWISISYSKKSNFKLRVLSAK